MGCKFSNLWSTFICPRLVGILVIILSTGYLVDSTGKIICSNYNLSVAMYTFAIRMTGNIHDAEDITQEILIKIITRLATFKGESSFRTWLYRIVSNYVLNMKRKKQEYLFPSFEEHRKLLLHSPDMEVNDFYGSDIEQKVLIRET
ncbi:sigma-70 family RNA polymerase sigma factor [Iocasia frigidifontis]|uniref:Sigma-70 family RNA polymerase sigma factor n=1 Tax=Iocasia fonsfrigidae TaxID=2682810 RepID=A0A8A7KAC1_9FIRM|nr:RNA polymerase sigma factor [Iocasia fonsfrigidae]QTL98190.1 sigma-70 family RNA polymerase sigma factor [Iocasia fonsfrigidae]